MTATAVMTGGAKAIAPMAAPGTIRWFRLTMTQAARNQTWPAIPIGTVFHRRICAGQGASSLGGPAPIARSSFSATPVSLRLRASVTSQASMSAAAS